MPKKIKKTQLDTLINMSVNENSAEAEAERPGWKPRETADEAQNPKRTKAFSKLFKPRQKAPEVTPVQSGSVDILDIIAPSSADLYHRDYIVVDGVYWYGKELFR